MSVNSSSSSNDSHLNPGFASIIVFDVTCLIKPPGSINFLIFNITSVLLILPLCILVLHHGFQQWRQKRFTSSSSSVTISHSDVFTYNMVVMELLRVFGCGLCTGICFKSFLSVGIYFLSFAWYGETFFHVLTCVERYLAVVHPITYRNLKSERGIRIRNISIVCVWMLCFAGMCTDMLSSKAIILNSFILAISLILISFYSLSVLCVLIRPGPGENRRSRQKVDRSKLRAFYTITAILGVLVLRFTCGLIWVLLYGAYSDQVCILMTFEFWVYLPGSLVLPILYLERVGKLECCRKNNQQG